jgi:hypothetical protein
MLLFCNRVDIFIFWTFGARYCIVLRKVSSTIRRLNDRKHFPFNISHLCFFLNGHAGWLFHKEENYKPVPAKTHYRSIYELRKRIDRSFTPAAYPSGSLLLIFATVEGADASLRLKTLSFLSFRTSQITSRIIERTPFRGTSRKAVRFFHQCNTDLLIGHSSA